MPIKSVAIIAMPGRPAVRTRGRLGGLRHRPHRRGRARLRLRRGVARSPSCHVRWLQLNVDAPSRPCARSADLVIVPAYGDRATRSEAVLDLLRDDGRRRRSGDERVLGGVHARRGRPARRPRLHDALDAHRRAGRAFPEGAGRPERAVRLRRPDPDLGRHGLRPRSVPAPDPRRSRRGDRPPGGPPDGHAATPRRRSGAVRRRAHPGARRGHAGAAARRARRRTGAASTRSNRSPRGRR